MLQGPDHEKTPCLLLPAFGTSKWNIFFRVDDHLDFVNLVTIHVKALFNWFKGGKVRLPAKGFASCHVVSKAKLRNGNTF
jgi:hypothetical protein